MKNYFCIYCMREIVPEVYEEGSLWIHDGVPHPSGFNMSDERVMQ